MEGGTKRNGEWEIWKVRGREGGGGGGGVKYEREMEKWQGK